MVNEVLGWDSLSTTNVIVILVVTVAEWEVNPRYPDVLHETLEKMTRILITHQAHGVNGMNHRKCFLYIGLFLHVYIIHIVWLEDESPFGFRPIFRVYVKLPRGYV